MSDDLVKRLRYLAKDIEAYESKTMSEAADRIEMLEAALREIHEKSHNTIDVCEIVCRVLNMEGEDD